MKPDTFPPGIYDQILTRTEESALNSLPSGLHAQTTPVASNDTQLISQYVAHQLRTRLRELPDVEQQLRLVNQVVDAIGGDEGSTSGHGYAVTNRILRAISPTGGDSTSLVHPDTPISENAIFTGGMNQLAIGPQLSKEIRTANEIYLLVSFIRQSGLDILWSALEEFSQRGGLLHVLTTTYMGATQLAAVDRLTGLNNADIRISFDTRFTRMHAKVYCFLRESGGHTAYIGSSNLSDAALSTGLEWNVKLSAMASPDTFEVVRATCEAYRHDDQFERYDVSMRDKLAEALERGHDAGHSSLSAMVPGEVVPYSYQQSILDRLEAERTLHNRTRNLVVAATGTGKTVIAAFDYARFRRAHENARLLFVAHRQEILEQARTTFRDILADAEFGDLQVGEHTADHHDHLFVSIQSLNSLKLWKEHEPIFYDYIVVDEFHHAAAPSYRKLLEHFTPQILLGLTATPERHDGAPILDYFDGRIAAEIRLPQAIDEGLLCPFRYFGLEDTVDLDQVAWTRNGYDVSALENVYVLDTVVAERRAKHVLDQFLSRVGDVHAVRGLGFCVSVAHAKFMADFFNQHGVPAAVISGSTGHTDRHALREQLERGDINVVFCVDVFNEGVDIPCINTIMLLRPTESLTVFVQQLGRGLRLHEGKESLLVLDFIGNANKNYRFEEKFAALLPKRPNLSIQVRNGFTHLPRGCYIELEEKPLAIVLERIARGFTSVHALLERIQEYVSEHGSVPNIAQFLNYYNLEPQQVYAVTSFDELLRKAGCIDGPQEPAADAMRRKALLRLSYIDSYRWLRRVSDMLSDLPRALETPLSEDDDLMLRMLFTTIWPNDKIPSMNSEEAKVRFNELLQSPRLFAEMQTLLNYLADKVAVMNIPLNIGKSCPLDIHCTYTRNQILAAMRYSSPRGMQSGVLWVDELQTDVLMITVRKSEAQYTQNTMYADYAIDASTFHWQSQNSTAEDSAVGQRYANHVKQGSHVLLFVREVKEDQYGPVPYRFIGPAEFMQSSGSKPMSILWKLRYPMAPEFEAQVSRVVV